MAETVTFNLPSGDQVIDAANRVLDQMDREYPNMTLTDRDGEAEQILNANAAAYARQGQWTLASQSAQAATLIATGLA